MRFRQGIYKVVFPNIYVFYRDNLLFNLCHMNLDLCHVFYISLWRFQPSILLIEVSYKMLGLGSHGLHTACSVYVQPFFLDLFDQQHFT